MERHRHDQVGLLEDFSPGARHPRSHGAGKFEAITVFEAMDEPARRPIVIAHDGAARPNTGGPAIASGEISPGLRISWAKGVPSRSQ